MKINYILTLLILVTNSVFAQQKTSQNEGLFAEIETNKGTIILDLNYKKTPVTVASFVSLAEGKSLDVDPLYKGKPFFNGLKFHRVINDFMIQGGDPLGTGAGEPGYKFNDEITDLKHDSAGVLSMANSGPNTNGSQFFITHRPTPHLDGKYTVFGKVIEGMDAVNKIVQNDTMKKITIVRKGSEAKKFNAAKTFNTAYAAQKEDKLKKAKEQELISANLLKEFINAKTTASGLKYIVINEGMGEKPSINANVKVHYTGILLNGNEFDSSVKRGEPIDLNLNQVISGWTEGLQLMSQGSKYKFFIPYNLAYGDRTMGGGVIPAKSDLIFEIELLQINK